MGLYPIQSNKIFWKEQGHLDEDLAKDGMTLTPTEYKTNRLPHTFGLKRNKKRSVPCFTKTDPSLQICQYMTQKERPNKEKHFGSVECSSCLPLSCHLSVNLWTWIKIPCSNGFLQEGILEKGPSVFCMCHLDARRMSFLSPKHTNLRTSHCGQKNVFVQVKWEKQSLAWRCGFEFQLQGSELECVKTSLALLVA